MPGLNFRRPPEDDEDPFPTGATVGALGLTGIGGALAYGGHRLGQISDMSFKDVHTALDPKAPVGQGSWASNWLQKRVAPYRPAAKDFTPGPNITTIPDAKIRDLQTPNFAPVDATLKRMLSAPDALTAQFAYAQGGNQILNTPAYGKYNALDIMKWLRSPSNKWFRSVFPQLSADWGEGALPPGQAPNWRTGRGRSTEHYNAFGESPLAGYVHMQHENAGKLHELFSQLGTARRESLSNIASGGVAPTPEAFKKDFTGRISQWIAPDFNPDMTGGVKPTTADPSLGQVAFQLAGASSGIPLSRQKAEATAAKLYDILEAKLPPDQRFAALQGSKPEQLINSAKGQEAAIRNAFGATDEIRSGELIDGLISRAQEIAKATPDKQQQIQLLQEKLKDDPVANLAAAAGYHHINYPSGLTFYRSLAEGLSAPGKAFQAAHKAAPWMTYGGGALAAAGGAYGLYRMMKWWKNKKKERRRQDVLDSAQNLRIGEFAKAGKDSTMSHVHFIDQCGCGEIYGQCRCMSKDKTVRVKQAACPKCRAALQTKQELDKAATATPRRRKRINGTP
jgi:hypothetical protein